MGSTEKTDDGGGERDGALRCPMCKAPSASRREKFFPFCSPRCQLADLGHWLGEAYRIPDKPHNESD